MQEQQGNLEEPLSGLPGPRPFNKNNKKGVPMEDNKKLDDIVTKATEALASGKAFGGWTDKVEEQVVKQGKPIPMKLGKGEPAGRSREEHQKKVDKGRIRQGNWKDSVEHDGASIDEKKKPIKKDEKKDGPWDTYDSVEHDGNDIQELDKSTLQSYIRGAAKDKADQAYAAGQNVQKVQSSTRGQDASAPAKAHDHQQRKMKSRARGISKAVRKLGDHVEHDGESVNEKVATRQRQLKNPKKEMLVVDKKGKVSTIDKKDWNRYKKQGYGLAEGLGSMIGGAIGSIVPGVGTAIGSAVGGVAGEVGKKLFAKKKQAGDPSVQ